MRKELKMKKLIFALVLFLCGAPSLVFAHSHDLHIWIEVERFKDNVYAEYAYAVLEIKDLWKDRDMLCSAETEDSSKYLVHLWLLDSKSELLFDAEAYNSNDDY